MKQRLNLLSQRFGRLIVIGKSKFNWKCLCDCGNKTITTEDLEKIIYWLKKELGF